MTWEELIKGIDLENVKSETDIIKVVKSNMKEHGVKILVDSTTEPGFIPKYRLDNEITKRKNAEDTIAELEKTLNTNKEEMKKIEDYKEEKEKLEKQIQQSQKNSLIKQEIGKLYNPHDMDEIINTYLDVDSITVKDNKIFGLREQLDTLTKEKAYLFKEPEGGTNAPGIPPANKASGGSEDSLGDKLAKSTFNNYEDMQQAQNDFFS